MKNMSVRLLRYHARLYYQSVCKAEVAQRNIVHHDDRFLLPILFFTNKDTLFFHDTISKQS